MDDDPSDYEHMRTETVAHRVRRRLGLTTGQGEVRAFVVQLEYSLDGEWTPVVRYDHAATGETAHDVSEDGLHIDIYRDGEKEATEFVAPPLPPGVALDYAEDHLSENLERFITRFEEWHGIRNNGP